MRIITGKFKGRTLAWVDEKGIRPATDHVRGSIFNMLQNRLDLREARVLDLFAGSGSLGFEALSRGASTAVFVDESPAALDLVEQNARKLGCLDECEILQDDAISFIDRPSGQYDLIFADPPYAYDRTPEIPGLVVDRKLLKSGGFLIMEHAKRTELPPSPSYRVHAQKEFGNTRISFVIPTA